MEGEGNIFPFLSFCSLLESRSPCNWNPRVTSIKVNLLLSLGPLMSTSIKKKHKSTVRWHLNEYKFSPGRSCVAGLFPAGSGAREEKSNFGLRSRFSSRCGQFWRRASDDSLPPKARGTCQRFLRRKWQSRMSELRADSESEINPFALQEEVLSNH